MKKFFLPKLIIHFEKWKYNIRMDCYVSNYGNIKEANGTKATVCKQNGYLFYKGQCVHRLVMETWKPVPGYNFLTVDHLNHNTFQNDIWNLEWVTAEENQKREKEDRKNKPENNIPPADTPIRVKLNGYEMSINDAKDMMYADPTLNKTKIDVIFKKIIITKQNKYGNFTIELCENKEEEK